jgi:hypothetical protein
MVTSAMFHVYTSTPLLLSLTNLLAIIAVIFDARYKLVFFALLSCSLLSRAQTFQGQAGRGARNEHLKGVAAACHCA